MCLSAVLVVLAGCSHLPELPEPGHFDTATPSGYLQAGPTVELTDPGATRPPTVLERLKERTERLEATEVEVRDLRRSNLALEEERSRLQSLVASLEGQVGELETTVAGLSVDLERAKEALVRTQIESTRLHQEILRQRIAEWSSAGLDGQQP